MKRAPGEALPSIRASPAQHKTELAKNGDPHSQDHGAHGARDSHGELGDGEPGEEYVKAEGGGGKVGDDAVPALGLEEHLEGEGEDEGEDDGDEPEGDAAGDGGDGGVLAEEAEDGGGEDEEGEEKDGGDEQDDPRALKVDAEHVALLGAEGLAAECLQRARHAQEDSISEAEKNGGDEGVRSEFGGSDVADEGLADDGDSEGREPGEDRRAGNHPQFLLLRPQPLPQP